MTKHFLLFLSILVGSFSAVGQKYSFGVKAGALMSWPGYPDADQRDTLKRGLKPGYMAAIVIGFPMKNQFDLIVEGGYSQKGRRIKFDGPGGEWLNKTTFKFIDMSMLLRKSYTFRLEKNVPATWYVNLGPEVSYWLSGKGEFTATGRWYPYTISFSDTVGNVNTLALPSANRWLFGIGFGAGIVAPLMANQTIGLEARFSSGHTYLSRKGRVSNDQFAPVFAGFEESYRNNLKGLTVAVTYSINFDVQRSRRGKSTLDKKVKNKKPSHRFR